MNILKRIAPGAVEPIITEGNNFFVVFSPVEIDIKRAGDEFASFGQGTGIRPGETFKRLEIRNPTLGTITVVIWIGGPEYHDARSAIIEPKTEGDGWNGTQLAATTGQTFDGIPTGFRIRRKSIQLTNLDQNLDLQLRDSAGHVVLTVFPRTSITLPVSETIEAYNPNGSPVACNISEIWWTL